MIVPLSFIMTISIASVVIPPAAPLLLFSEELLWEPRPSYDSTPSESLGRHHPITFANETHGFLLGGSTLSVGGVPDLHIYDEAAGVWIDASHALLNSLYPARTYGYGVVLDEYDHPKAYLGFGSGESGGRLRTGGNSTCPP
jgi:hypothetical protein